MNLIDIHDLCFAYGDREILHNIDLQVEEGSYAIMVGPNGGGKTTLLRLILGLLEPVYGRISVFGTTPQKARPFLSYVPQSLQYDDQFPVTVQEVVLMGRVGHRRFGPYRKNDHEAAAQALEEVNLAGYGKRPFSALSGGERQRTLVAQALVSFPRLLLLDEPGANLDPENRILLYELLHKLNRHLTVLMVSHNLNVVASYASHVICVNRTADMHPMSEIRREALVEGAWAHLTHEHCPVGDQELAALHSPHHGKPHN